MSESRVGRGVLNRLIGRRVAHPLAKAARAKKIIAALPYHDALQTIVDASHWLRSIGETPAFDAVARYELIEKFDNATRACQRSLRDTCVGQKDTSDDSVVQEKRIRQAMSEFWTLLGECYLACAAQCIDAPRLPRPLRSVAPLIAARGVRSLRQQLQWGVMRYGALRESIWAECGRYILLAEALGTTVEPLALYADSAARPSLHDELLRLVMFWAASPGGLSPVEQDIARRVIQQLAPKFHVSAERSHDADYFLDVQAAHAPLRLVRSSPSGANLRYFSVGAARQAARVLHALVSGGSALPIEIPRANTLDGSDVARVLAHLLRSWAKEMPARAEGRRKAALTLAAVQGYPRVLGVVAPDEAQMQGALPASAHESWQADDASDGGYGVIVPPGIGEALRAGDVIALRAAIDIPWQIGLIRRVKADARQQRQIGIQVISRAPTPIYLRTFSGVARGGKRQCAILLSAQPATDGTVDLLVRRDLLNDRESVEAQYGPTRATVILDPDKVVESGRDFDWLRYKFSGPLS